MCSFDGLLREYPWISIDSFHQHNCQSSQVFFISHIHTDHLRGLDQSLFSQYLTDHPSIRIYCSEATRYFLSNLSAYKHLSKFYRVLNVDQAIALENPLDSNLSITVTCFGSGHCPGSLMLLFEGSNGTVLYTGDFRFYSHQSIRHHSILSKKSIDTLYIDMTFFEPTIRQLPERHYACEKLIEFISSNPYHSFYLKTSARVGYEYIYMKLHEHFRSFIHVNPEQYQLYNCLPKVQQVLTTNSNATRIHACWPRCSETRFSIKVVLSVLWFTMQQNQQFKSPLIQISKDYYRLCYSLHSSYNEICTFVKQISPHRIYPIALPNQITSERFNELIKQLGIDQTTSTYRSFPSNDIQQQQIKRRYEIHDDEQDDELDFIGDEKNFIERITNLQIQSLNTKNCK